MPNNRHAIIVMTNAVAGREEEFNKWYDSVHVPQVLAIPGYVAATRFEVVTDWEGAPSSPEQRFLTIYEIEGDPAEISARMFEAIGEGRITMSDAARTDDARTMWYRCVAPRITA